MATTLFQGDFTIFRISYVQRRKYLFCEEKPRRRLNQLCFASKGRGFGPEPAKGDKDTTRKTSTKRSSTPLDPSKGTSDQPMMRNGQAPGLLSGREVSSNSNNIVSDRQFMEKLEAVRRSAREKKNAEAEKLTQSIDYDAPIESDKSTMGLGTKVGVGIAVVVFGLVFAFGDFLPSGSINSDEVQIAEKKLPDEQKAILKSQLQNFEETLSTSPNDLSALEGAAVTLAELGEYKEASSYLEKLIKGRPEDPEAYRLLGEVKYEMKDFENSATAYKNSLSASKEIELETLRGLTNSLLAAKKPEEAVKVLLSTSEQINAASQVRPDKTGDVNEKATKDQENADPIQVHLLLGKAYSDWGHVSDAVAVFDQLISHYPNDFRGYLAKGIILKENGKAGDAERMFIQAKFFAPDKAKSLVDRYARN